MFGPRPSRQRARCTTFRRGGDVIVSVAGYPAPAKIGVQMYSQGTMCKMIAQCTQQGRSIDEAIAFAEQELEGYMRT
jgi:hypothetical protein